MTISVIIPAYNGAATIANAIESILRQTRAPDEIIVSDDCSTDSTAEEAARYSERVRYVRRATNGGLSANLNTGVGAIWGVAALPDQDDELPPRALNRLTTAETTEPSGMDSSKRRRAAARLVTTAVAVGEPVSPGEFLVDGDYHDGCVVSSLVDRRSADRRDDWQAEI
jgi:glycosyltransferase involved in cell wall biosynthesis